MEGRRDQSNGSGEPGGRFVLLVQPAEPRPAKLLDSLYKRGVAVRLASDAPTALVEVSQFRAQVLVVHNASRVVGLESLLAAVRLYFPSVICWRHEPANATSRERLLPFICELTPAPAPRMTDAPASPPPAGASHTNGNGNGSKLHVASPAGGSGRQPTSGLGHRLANMPHQRDPVDDLTSGPLLSAEEIDLLRGPLEDTSSDAS